eukprot:8705396-Alexandrium_andersonii.AAC.1
MCIRDSAVLGQVLDDKSGALEGRLRRHGQENANAGALRDRSRRNPLPCRNARRHSIASNLGPRILDRSSDCTRVVSDASVGSALGAVCVAVAARTARATVKRSGLDKLGPQTRDMGG